VVRLALTAVLAWLSVTRLPTLLGVPRDLAAAFITATTGIAAWIEYALLRRALAARIGGDAALPRGRSARLWLSAVVAALLALGLKVILVARLGARASGEWGGALLPMPRLHPALTAALVLPVYGGLYLALASALGVPHIGDLLRRRLRRP
jgi:putative peptidoglycan lipid II flippase